MTWSWNNVMVRYLIRYQTVKNVSVITVL